MGGGWDGWWIPLAITGKSGRNCADHGNIRLLYCVCSSVALIVRETQGACMRSLTLAFLVITGLSFADSPRNTPERSAMGRIAQQVVQNITGVSTQTSPCLNEPECEFEGPGQTQAET